MKRLDNLSTEILNVTHKACGSPQVIFLSGSWFFPPFIILAAVGVNIP